MRKLTWLMLLAMICLYISCRKTDFPIAGKTSLTTEARFTNSHRSDDPVEKAIVEYVKRTNAQKPFIEETVKRIGYPYWDKTVSYTAKSASSSLVGAFGTTKLYDNKDPQPVNIYYVPFVRDSQNYVNASMVIKTSLTDTSISYLCDWQYQRLQNEDNKLNDAAEYFAAFFMMLDKAALGHTKFTITDKNIFRSNNHSPREVILNTKPSNQPVGSNMYYMEVCENVSITYTNCPFIPQRGYCVWGEEGCDNCSSCTSVSFYSYCWGEWVDSGGGGSTGGGDTGGGSTGGGSGGEGGPIPPNPCDDPPPVYNPDAVTQQRQSRISAFGSPCNSEPGWQPSNQDNKDMAWFNSTPTYNIDINSANLGPCITSIVNGVLSNTNNDVITFIKEKFSESTKYNIKFEIDNTIGVPGKTEQTPFYEKRENSYGKFVKLNLLIKINTSFTSTKMAMAQIIMHELLHAYYNYRTVDATGDPAKEQKLKEELGFLQPFDPNAASPTSDNQHEQMANSYIDKFVSALKQYRLLTDADLADFKVNHPETTLDDYYQALAWGGLTESSTTGNYITNAWKEFKTNNPQKAQLYMIINSYELQGAELAPSKIKCN